MGHLMDERQVKLKIVFWVAFYPDRMRFMIAFGGSTWRQLGELDRPLHSLAPIWKTPRPPPPQFPQQPFLVAFPLPSAPAPPPAPTRTGSATKRSSLRCRSG